MAVLIAALATALTALGLVVMTLGVAGLFRMPDLYLELHAASKAVALGVAAIAVAVAITGSGGTAARAALVAAALLVTSPAGTHAVARAAYRREREAGGDEESEGMRRTP